MNRKHTITLENATHKCASGFYESSWHWNERFILILLKLPNSYFYYLKHRRNYIKTVNFTTLDNIYLYMCVFLYIPCICMNMWLPFLWFFFFFFWSLRVIEWLPLISGNNDTINHCLSTRSIVMINCCFVFPSFI